MQATLASTGPARVISFVAPCRSAGTMAFLKEFSSSLVIAPKSQYLLDDGSHQASANTTLHQIELQSLERGCGKKSHIQLPVEWEMMVFYSRGPQKTDHTTACKNERQ